MKLPNFEEMTVREVIELRDALDDFFNKFGLPRRSRTPYRTYDFNATAHTLDWQKPVQLLARENNISPQTLYGWKRRIRIAAEKDQKNP